ncbi:MAG: SPFH domain-containing protein [Patescibacteria group bacterium]|nr:SPFH domain-containing protein [Patescibacteria group bacterium]
MRVEIDRILGAIFTLLALTSIYMTLTSFWYSSWFLWTLLTVWTLALSVWVWDGWSKHKLEVGHKGQLLFLGSRLMYFFQEGRRFAPKPFGIKTTDCRKQIMPLDKLEVITKDNVKVLVGGTVVYHVENLDTFFSIAESGLRKGIDDTRDQAIRGKVRGMDLEKVLDSHQELGGDVSIALQSGSAQWGVHIDQVIVPEIAPDPKVVEDLELKERENLQRDGQIVELEHFSNRVKELMLKSPDGPGLSREQAIEQVQLTLGQTTKATDAKNITLDSATAQMLATILGGKK